MQAVPIGTVLSPVTDAVDSGWGSIVSRIHVREDLAAGLDGLASFSHVVVVYEMHAADFDPVRDLRRRPRGRDDMPEVGIFAQRARHRPNRIGISTVELLAVDGPVLRVRGLDAVDGTPVLDIKPFARVFDCADGATEPAWFARLMHGYF